ncbi:SOS response-associated peptidase [Aquincola tertiaricarbonis]|uniref:SOS response-associated peptidase n=1 Tax=Aquincola tertiaricarbonis TaxID=391953 RepID=UPI0006149CD6
MCNRYHPARAEEMTFYREVFGVDEPPRGHIGDPLFPRDIGPFGQGVFLRTAPESGQLQEVLGQWGLIGWFAKSAVPPRKPGRGGPILTNNARMETIGEKPTFRDPWKRGQRCIIPAWSYVEPNWESGRNQWWRFRRADGQPWGMAGLWNTWIDKQTGEVVESYTMVTLNADHHPLLNRMHRPDPTRPTTMQDKRAVVPLHPSAFDAWLRGTVDEATAALALPHIDDYDAGPDQPSLLTGGIEKQNPDQLTLL